MPEANSDNKFVEVDGVKYQPNPEVPGEAMKGEDGKFVPYEEPAAPAAPVKPEIRRSAKEPKDYIIERQKNKLDKLKNDKGGDDDDDDDEDDLTPESKKAINKGIEKQMKPIRDANQQSAENRATQADADDLKAGLKKYPKAKDMEDSIKSYMEAYPNAQVNFIIRALLQEKQEVEEKKAKAEEDEKKNNLGGSSRRSKKGGAAGGDIPDVTTMSKEEFNKFDRDVKQGKYLP